MYTHTCTHIYTAALNGLQELLFQLTGLEMFYVKISSHSQSAACLYTYTHTAYLHCLTDTFCLQPFSSYCALLPENKHL